jgi:hypothetical protein
MGCPIIWASKLQTEMALSTREAKYGACSKALQHVIPFMKLLEEAHDLGIQVSESKAKILCKLFCDNSGAFKLIRLPKLHPHTKHINTKLHHFLLTSNLAILLPSLFLSRSFLSFAISSLDGNSLNIKQGSMGLMEIYMPITRHTFWVHDQSSFFDINPCILKDSDF